LAFLHDKLKNRGFHVLAFPSNDFHQEKDTDAEIWEYVQTNFPQAKFPIFARAPLASNTVFRLCERHTGEAVAWNFHKYLVDGQGRAVKSFGHRVPPMAMEEDILQLLHETERRRFQVPQTH